MYEDKKFLDFEGLQQYDDLIKNYADNVIIAISSSAPLTCAQGDIYYNSTSKKLIRATAINTWSTTVNSPTKDRLYYNVADRKLYRWNGSDMVVIQEGITGPIKVEDENTYTYRQTAGGKLTNIKKNEFTLVNNPTGNPASQGMYELTDSGRFIATADTTGVAGKNYFSRMINGKRVAKIENIKGNTVKVVQIRPTGFSVGAAVGVTFTNDNGVVVVNGTTTELSYVQFNNVRITTGHKYYLKGCPAGGGFSTYYVTAPKLVGSDTGGGQICTVQESNYDFLRIYVQSGVQANSLRFAVMLFDLTLMGIDSLTTVEEVEAWLASHLGKLDYIPYTAGKLVNYGGYGVKWNQLDKGNVVDMGLPSGTLWAIANLDATTQSGFAEVDGKPSPFKYECTFFSLGNKDGHHPIRVSAFDYDWGSGNSGPYASTPGATLTANAGLSFDAARAILGAPWRDPSTDDFAELFNNIDYVDANGDVISGTNKLTTINGITGIRLKSKNNGNILFFPCSGVGNGQSWVDRGSYGGYWSRSLGLQAYGRGLGFYSGGVYPQDYGRFYGFARRAVTTPISTDEGYHKFFSKDKTIIDLTLMFGEGNEPDLDWCNKWLSRDSYPYCQSVDRNILDVMEEKTIVDGVAQYNNPPMGMKTVGFNLWDGTILATAKVINPRTGNEDTWGASWAISDYIEITPNTQYYLKESKMNTYDEDSRGYAFYDSNKNYISGGVSATFTTPDNARYFRFSTGSTDYISSNLNLSDPAKNGQYEPYWESFSDMSWITKIGIPDFNIWDEEWENGEYDSGTGQKSPAGSYIRCKNYIPVFPDVSYYVKPIYGNCRIYFYDSSKNYISYVSPDSSSKFTTPTNAAYITFNTFRSYGTTYNHDICINISIPAYNGKYLPHGETMPYFPNGLCNVGNVFDEVKVENGKIKGVVRFSEIDLGELEYIYNSSAGHLYFRANISGAKRAINGNEKANIVCSKYANSSGNSVYGNFSDKTIAIPADNDIVMIYDSSYTDAATFKAAMQGVKLIYELATPYEFEIDMEDFVDAIEMLCDAYGTEQAVLPESEYPVSSAPMLATEYRGDDADKLPYNLDKIPDGEERKLSDYAKKEDIPEWAKQPTKPSYNLDEVPDGLQRKLSDCLKTNDIASWAKKSSKPSYTWSEIGEKPAIPELRGVDDPSSLISPSDVVKFNNIPIDGQGGYEFDFNNIPKIFDNNNQPISQLHINVDSSGIADFVQTHNSRTDGLTIRNDAPSLMFDSDSGNASISLRSPELEFSGNNVNDAYFDMPVKATDFINVSDRRKKDIIEDISLSVKDIAHAPSVKFKWKEGNDDKEHIGTIAQYWMDKLPEAVVEDKDGILSMNYSATAVVACISLAKQVEKLTSEITKLKGRIKKLEEPSYEE